MKQFFETLKRHNRCTGLLRRTMQTFILLTIFLLATGCSEKNESKEILVGAAASLKPVMEEITSAFTKKYPEITVNYNFAGSGALEQQIREGANMDVFVSAAKKQMDSLESDNLLLKETRVDLLKNQLVLIVPNDTVYKINSFEDIKEVPVIALGDPNSVPVGQYAEETLEFYGIADLVHTKAVYGKDVSEVLSWVSTGNADAGVVYKTDALSNKTVAIAATAPLESHSEIVYPAAVISTTKKEAAAKKYLDFLQSKEAKDIFKKYGFGIVE